VAKSAVKKTRDPEWYKSVNGADKPKFVNYDLSEDDKKSFKAWAHENIDNLLDFIEKVVEAGYGVSVKWDVRGQCYASFLTCNRENDPNKGWILSGRGSTAFSAIMGALFRHLVLFDGIWPIDEAQTFPMDDN